MHRAYTSRYNRKRIQQDLETIHEQIDNEGILDNSSDDEIVINFN